MKAVERNCDPPSAWTVAPTGCRSEITLRSADTKSSEVMRSPMEPTIRPE